MSIISTNAIRNFADRVRGLTNAREISLSSVEARNLNHEIQMLLARLIELQDQAETGKIQVELKTNKF